VKIEKRYLDEEEWTEIRRELAVACLTQIFRDPEKVLAEMEANERTKPGSGTVRTPYAFYRVMAE